MQVKVRIKRVFGKKFIYVIDKDQAAALKMLTKRDTLTIQAVQALSKLGVEVVETIS